MKNNYKIIMVGTGDPSKPPLLISYVKTYLESCDSLKGKIETKMVYPLKKGFFEGIKEEVLKENPNMVTITPHEDWDNASMYILCNDIKKANENIVIVFCSETERNRVMLEEVENSKTVDHVIYGEAEVPFEKLLNYYVNGIDSAWDEIPNLKFFTVSKKCEKTGS